MIDQYFKGPSLLTGRGRIYWSITVIMFWWVGFVIGAAIPQVQTLSGMVGAVTNMVSYPHADCVARLMLTALAIHVRFSDRVHLLISSAA